MFLVLALFNVFLAALKPLAAVPVLFFASIVFAGLLGEPNFTHTLSVALVPEGVKLHSQSSNRIVAAVPVHKALQPDL